MCFKLKDVQYCGLYNPLMSQSKIICIKKGYGYFIQVIAELFLFIIFVKVYPINLRFCHEMFL